MARRAQRYGPWPLGMVNRRDAEDPAQESNAQGLARAVNVLVTVGGLLRRRPGLRRIVALSGVVGAARTDLFDGPWLIVAAAGALWRVSPSGSLAQILDHEDTPVQADGDEFHSTELAGAFYWSCGRHRGVLRVCTDGVVRSLPWAPSMPTGVSVQASATGSLPAGRYGVAVTRRVGPVDLAVETPAWSAWVDNPRGIDVLIVGDGEGVSYEVYVTQPNGTEFRRVQSLGPTGGTYSYLTQSRVPGRRLEMTPGVFRPAPAPVGRGFGALARIGGSILIANGPWIWVTPAGRPHVVEASSGWLKFPSNITSMTSVGSACWVQTKAGTFLVRIRDGRPFIAQRVDQGGPVQRTCTLGGAGVFLKRRSEGRSLVPVLAQEDGRMEEMTRVFQVPAGEEFRLGTMSHGGVDYVISSTNTPAEVGGENFGVSDQLSAVVTHANGVSDAELGDIP